MNPASGGERGDRPPGLKLFAWAGLRFHLPPDWETGQLAIDHGWLEHDFQPVLEFKTAIIRGRFSFRRHLKQLEQTSPLRLHHTDLPAAWRPHLTRFETRAFTWQGPHLAGEGLVIYCPECRRATLLQFYRSGRAAGGSVLQVLASFSDHGAARRPTVGIYDIQVTVPTNLPLKRFRFDSGRFALVFGGRREQVTLWRWSPADAALRHHDGSLHTLARGLDLSAGADLSGVPRPTNPGLEWRWPNRRPWRDRVTLLRSRQLPPTAFRIWHLPAVNRILAVRGDGELGYDTFSEICRDYGIVY